MELNEKKNALSELMGTTMSKIKEMVDTNMIVAEPIVADGVTLVPISRMSFGFGTGGGELGNTKNFAGGGGAGVHVEPVAFLIVQNGTVRIMPVAIPAVTTVDRVIEMVPDLVDKVEGFVNKKKESRMYKEEV